MTSEQIIKELKESNLAKCVECFCNFLDGKDDYLQEDCILHPSFCHTGKRIKKIIRGKP